MLTAPPVGTTLTATSQLPNLQPTDLTNQGGFYPRVINDALDRLTIFVQQLAEKLGRTLRFPLSDGAVADMPGAAARANNLLSFDANGNPVAVAPAAQSATALQILLAAPVGASLIGYAPVGTGAVASTVETKLRLLISPGDFGASPSNTSAQNTAAFALLESAHPGESIDLFNGQYSVDSLPTGCRYFNGDFILGPTRISLRRNKLDNPLDGNSFIAFGDGTAHYWLFGFVHIESTGKLLAFVKPGYRHAESDSTPLNVIESDDRGATWKSERTIYAVSGFDISHSASCIMGNGRIGLVAYVKHSDFVTGIVTGRNDFIYSDDAGYSWSSAIDIVPAASAFTYGDMLKYPAVAGGNDSFGFAVYGYGSSAQQFISTIDNGASWNSASIANVTSDFNEVSVVRVNAESKWIMFLRSKIENQAAPENLFVATSTNMKVWTIPADTGYQLGGNPVYAIVDGGRLFVYCCIRDYYAVAGGLQNQLICFEESPSQVYAAGNLVNKSPRAIADIPDRGVGYICIRKVSQDFVWGYAGMESEGSTNQPGASCIIFGSTRRVPVAGPALVNTLSGRANLIRNPTFEFWSRGTSFTTSVETKTADCWKYQASGATGTNSRVRLAPEVSVLFSFNPHYAYNLAVTVPSDYAGIFQDFNGEDELYRFSGQKITIQVWGIGEIPDSGGAGRPRLSIVFNYGTGGSASDTNSVYPNFVESSGNIWKGVVTIQCPKIFGGSFTGDPAITIGANPYVRILFDSGAALSWNATICGIKAEFGSYASRFDAPNYSVDKLLRNLYVQTIDASGINAICNLAAQSTTQASGVISYSDVSKIPTISLLSGVASDFEIYPSGAAISSMTFSNIGKRSASINVVTTGLAVAGAYILRVKAGASPVILIDAD